jgi:hypothetical protein
MLETSRCSMLSSVAHVYLILDNAIFVKDC